MYPQFMFLAKIRKQKITYFAFENCHFYQYLHYVNVSVLKVFTIDQCFYHKFSIKSYVLDVY